MPIESASLARVLVARHREQRVADEARAARLRQRVAEVVAQAVRKRLFDRAWLIGSLAWGGFGVRSDVDLVVEGLPPERAGEVWAEIGSELEANVDLLRLEALGPDFRQRVLSKGIPLGEGQAGVP